MSFKKGDKIVYSYTHHLNSKSRTIITKVGVFVRTLKDGLSNYIVIKLDANKNNSIVHKNKVSLLK